jgi:hypothetical protein
MGKYEFRKLFLWIIVTFVWEFTGLHYWGRVNIREYQQRDKKTGIIFALVGTIIHQVAAKSCDDDGNAENFGRFGNGSKLCGCLISE